MITSVADERITDVRTTDDELVVDLADGRTLSVPLVWYPRLLNASAEQRSEWHLIGDGHGVHWPQIDEDLSAAGLLRGIPAPAARPHRPHAKEIRAQAVNMAKDFYGDSIGKLKGELQSDRAALENLAEQIPQGEAQARIQEMVDSYTAIEETLDQAAQQAREALAQQAQEAAGEATQQMREVARQAPEQVGQVAEHLPGGQLLSQTTNEAGQIVQRAVVESGDIIETTLDESGNLVGEDIVGSVFDSPVEEEYHTEEGQTIRTVREASGSLIRVRLGADDSILDLAISKPNEEVTEETVEQPSESQSERPEEPDATETARQRAEELGVDLSQIEGSGAGGRIIVKDVTRAAHQ